MNETCIFCQIIAGQSPASFVYQDKICSAFMDIQPVNPGHLLVIPNQHASQLKEVDDQVLGHMMKIAKTMGTALRHSGVTCEGVNLWLADGEAAGQEVFHVHLHVLPRFKGDGFGLKFGPDYGITERKILEEISAKIRALTS